LWESNPLARRGSPFLVRGPCSDHRWSTEPPLLVSEFGLCGSRNLGDARFHISANGEPPRNMGISASASTSRSLSATKCSLHAV
jgi:hypothetical protein